uniref:Uncharacterized protein n=1 Tax=Physcomitrium patens TaxID=3218 RepID=A0A2K1KFG0_PHYPA|nr:hypothetical protein PHYPA_008891 [Physcomitrium patens]
MRREVHISGKPSNHCRVTGKCRVVGCQTCHAAFPINKSRGKGKGRIKRLLSDFPSTHLLSDWRVNKPSLLPSRKIVRPSMKGDIHTDRAADDEYLEGNENDDDVKEPERWALSISLLLGTALENMQETVRARNTLQKVEMAFDGQEHEGLSVPLSKHTDAINADEELPDLDSFKNEFEEFKSENRGYTSAAESADSWSGIELSDADEFSLEEWEDEWSMVENVIPA